MKRRDFLAASATAGAAALTGFAPSALNALPKSLGGRLKLSVSRWPYGKFSLDQLCQMCRELDMDGIDLLEPEDWGVPLRYGLVCAMGYATVPHPENRLIDGFNRVENHSWLIPAYQKAIPLAAASKVPNVICFSGTRKGQSDDEGRDICARGLAPLIPLAEKHGVTLCMELLNSKVDHPDYQCDHTAWGVALAKQVNSPRFQLLYDIYHMQIMEGDVIRTVTDNIKYIAHFHTGGVPGRHEIDDTQELNYHRVMQAIADAGFPGFVAQEFVPTKDPRQSLAEAVRICTV
ncbi:MAG TPA: TIM barrel protein [Gemmatimonadaceae bacterium]|jgi:hydroxypyruvate isomerase|nr:TIM barrel protein [Gemmatimonadaceae bacterium]